MAKAVASSIPGYASVARAADILHLAPRSVRSLIYAGRLPSLRVGRLHYIKTTDVELERRRRLGLPLPSATRKVHRQRRSTPHLTTHTPRISPEVRRQRAAERIELVKHWAQRHPTFDARVPAAVHGVDGTPVTCQACQRQVRRGRYVEFTPEAADAAEPATQLCLTCARRALLEWADHRRQEAAAARRLAQSLGQPEPEPVRQLHLLVA